MKNIILLLVVLISSNILLGQEIKLSETCGDIVKERGMFVPNRLVKVEDGYTTISQTRSFANEIT